MDTRYISLPISPSSYEQPRDKSHAFVLKKSQTSMPPAGFKRAAPVSQRPQTHALDRAATRIGTTKEFGRLWKKNAVLKFDALFKNLLS